MLPTRVVVVSVLALALLVVPAVVVAGLRRSLELRLLAAAAVP